MTNPPTTLLAGLLLTAACASAPPPKAPPSSATSTAQPWVVPDAPRDRARALLEIGIGQARPDVVRALISDDYTQHNPRVSDGPEALVSFVQSLADGPPGKVPKVRVVSSIVDSAFVLCHSEYRRGGRDIAGFDLFRLRDGLLIEHWDAGRSNAPTPSGHTRLDGAIGDLSTAHDASANRERVERFAREGLIDGNAAAFDVVASNVIQHDPLLLDGRAAWRDGAKATPARLETIRILAEGDLVATQSRGEADGRPAVVYDLFRLAGGEIVEHWTSHEPVPAQSANNNGMW